MEKELYYKIYVNSKLYKDYCIQGKKATYDYMKILEEKGTKNFLKYNDLTVFKKYDKNKNINYLTFRFENDMGDSVEHTYNLI